MNLVFADGSSRGNPGPGGWGAIVLTKGKVVELGGEADPTTNNEMELLAAIEGLKIAVRGKSAVKIHLDSSYVIKGATQWAKGWARNGWTTQAGDPVQHQELWKELLRILENDSPPIQWVHVPGHRGVPGNERADQIATQFADGITPHLYKGEVEDYDVDLTKIEPKKPKASKSKKGKAYSYLSKVDGVIERHATWAECQNRVSGRSNAKYKKAMSAEEEEEIRKLWSS